MKKMKINVFATGENCIALDNYLRFIISTSVQSSWLNCCSNGFAGTNYAFPFDWSMIKFVDWRHVMMKDCEPRLDFVLFLLANGNWIKWENFANYRQIGMILWKWKIFVSTSRWLLRCAAREFGNVNLMELDFEILLSFEDWKVQSFL